MGKWLSISRYIIFVFRLKYVKNTLPYQLIFAMNNTNFKFVFTATIAHLFFCCLVKFHFAESACFCGSWFIVAARNNQKIFTEFRFWKFSGNVNVTNFRMVLILGSTNFYFCFLFQVSVTHHFSHTGIRNRVGMYWSVLLANTGSWGGAASVLTSNEIAIMTHNRVRQKSPDNRKIPLTR